MTHPYREPGEPVKTKTLRSYDITVYWPDREKTFRGIYGLRWDVDHPFLKLLNWNKEAIAVCYNFLYWEEIAVHTEEVPDEGDY